MGSVANVTASNIELSPMIVKLNGVDLGGTSGGVTVSLNHEHADITVDQLGKTPIDSVLVGQTYSVKMTLTETKNKDIWKVAFPSLYKATTGSNSVIYADAQIGDHLLARALTLVLHPQSKDAGDFSGDFKFFKAVAKSATEISYGVDNQVGLEVEFMVYPDATSTPVRYWLHGDPSVGLVAASAAAPSFSGTGDGTMGTISAGASAVGETITAICIAADTDSGIFEVSGSISGPLGNATVGVAFASPKINFTIADGATDFIVADEFTVVITGPNYA